MNKTNTDPERQKEMKMKNMSKWKSYKLAYEHIDEAIKQGFFIEALALEESIISDRLDSAVKGKGIDTTGKTRLLGTLSEFVRANPKEFQGLHEWLAKKGLQFEDVDAWRWERNKFVHHIAHGLPEQETPVTAEEYDERGRKAAKAGLKLARAICDWSKSEIRALKAANKAKETSPQKG